MEVRFEYVATRGDGSTITIEEEQGGYYVSEYKADGSFISTTGAWSSLDSVIRVAEAMGDDND
jgi:hypothetical protein